MPGDQESGELLILDRRLGQPRTSYLVYRWLPHDLRRTAVRNLEYSDVSRSTAMAILQHRSDSIYRMTLQAIPGRL
jgi:hypothetical protein